MEQFIYKICVFSYTVNIFNFFFPNKIESLGSIDNCQLKTAVNEVEGMLTSLIDTVENSRASSTQPSCP